MSAAVLCSKWHTKQNKQKKLNPNTFYHMSGSVSIFFLSQFLLSWDRTRSVTWSKDQENSSVSFHFISLLYIYSWPDAPIYCKWQGFIWSTQVIEAIRVSPLPYKHLWTLWGHKIQMHAHAWIIIQPHTNLKDKWLCVAVEDWLEIPVKRTVGE